jgi:hypothetical protein
MTTDNEKDIGKLEGIIEGVSTSLNRIEKDLHGNGQPGAMQRITRIEENLENLAETVKANIDSINTLAQSISELKIISENHNKDTNLHTPKGLIFRKETLLYLILIFLLVHAFIPESVNVWFILSKLIGI